MWSRPWQWNRCSFFKQILYRSCFLYTAWKHHQMAVCTAKQYAELSELWKTMTGERRQHKTQRRTRSKILTGYYTCNPTRFRFKNCSGHKYYHQNIQSNSLWVLAMRPCVIGSYHSCCSVVFWESIVFSHVTDYSGKQNIVRSCQPIVDSW